MKAPFASAVAIAIFLAAGGASARNFGSVGMGGHTQLSMLVSPSAHSERICNGYFSDGTVVASINGGAPKALPAGQCLETYAQTVSVLNPQDGPAYLSFGRSGHQNL
jgi:hypothetical protein